MEEDFYAVIKLISGEEIFSIVCPSEEEGRTMLILNNPVTIEVVVMKQIGMQGYKIDLNKELGFDHLKPVSVEERDENYRILEAENSISLLNWVKSEGYSTEISKNGEIFWKNRSKKIKMIDSSDLYDRYINR